MKKIFIFSTVSILCLNSCSRKQEQKDSNLISPRITEARGYVVPKDSIAEPEVVIAGKPTVIMAGKLKKDPANFNVVIAGKPKVVKAGTPVTYTPGKNGFALPKTVPAVENPFVAGVPRTFPVKETYFKDNFPRTTSSFVKLRGLSLSQIHCIMKDKSGNVWIGTDGGVTRFNGKFHSGFSKKQGLPGSETMAILQDRHGNLWFGTAGGITRYDGIYMTNFTEKEGLASSRIECAFEDKKGNLWFGTLNGIVTRYDGNNFTHFSLDTGAGEFPITSIAEDTQGTLWFGSDNGLFAYNGIDFKNYTEKEGLSNSSIQRVVADHKGNLWVATSRNGITFFNGKTFTHYTTKEGLSADGIWDMTLDDGGNLWLATIAGGVCRFDGAYFTRFSTPRDLVDDYATSIYSDHQGNIWVGGGRSDGLMRLNDICFSHYTKMEGLADNNFLALLKDKSGNIWIGFNLGEGADRYDGRFFTHFNKQAGLTNRPITCILQDMTGKIWFATYGKGAICYDGTSFLHFSDQQGFSGIYLRAMLEDRAGNLWFGTEGQGLYRYDGKTFTQYTTRQGLSDNTVLSALEDKSGSLWFGTGSGATLFDGKSFTHFSTNEGFCNNTILGIYQDMDDNIWFCTLGKGAVRYNGRTFLYLTEKEGLKTDNVNGMMQDKKGNYYFACGSGLSILPQGNLEKLIKNQNDENGEPAVLFRNFNPEDGYSGWGCNGSIIEDDQGGIWMTSSDRITVYHPEKDIPDTTAPSMQMTGIQLYNETIPWPDLAKNKDTCLVLGNGIRFGNFSFDSLSMWYSYPENLSLTYKNNYLTFTFIGIVPKLNTLVKYRYKLDGLDENWSALSTRTEAAYGNIPPGTYTFKVKAMNGEGYWSKECKYTFTIRPPWWRTWWAYCGYMLIFIAAFGFVIYSVIEYQRRKIRLIVSERNRIARELHDDIGAELTRITILSQFLEKNINVEGEVREKLMKISETGKKVLGSIGEIIWTMNPQKDNLDSLAAHIRRFVTEYLETNGIDINIEFPDEIPANAVSDDYRRNVFLAVKEAISNISKYSKATSVKLSMKIREKIAEVEISDNGTGFSVKEKENWGNGLRNMEQRMKDIGGTFLIRSEISQGTLIRFTFPVR